MNLNDFRSAIDKMDEPELSEEIAQLTDEDLLKCNLMFDLAFSSMDVIELLTIIEREHGASIPEEIFLLTDNSCNVRNLLEEINKNI